MAIISRQTIPSRSIAVALAPRTTADGRMALQRAAEVADIAELRLDLMVEFDLPDLLAGRPCPVIVTYRPVREGGRYGGPEAERIAVLKEAVHLGAEYIDVELDCADLIGDRGATRLIISRHDFERMPADPAGLWRQIRDTGADVVKIAGRAAQANNCVALLETLARADVPTIAIAMGEAGLPSRVLALKSEACLLIFCAADDGGTAPGQLTVDELVGDYRGREIGPATAAFGVISPRTETTLARAYNRGFRERGLDAVAVPLLVPPDGDAADTIAAYRALDLQGYHVLSPHQETVGQALDQLDPSACRAGKVNAISRRGDGLVGAWVGTAEERLELWAEGVRLT